ncbi:nitronate monooxygenase family protein [uncultured Cocleimonas sp.]|uniref:NAD(P)H-dependent flavin oxidoreductase n=1 Tax=uncultured Cocleimonas sp. TaxID=1051587 RepID=UPI002606F9E4|nr:nitronate monooxygenase [uncultured Cocleimonas sp.]
MDKHEFLEVEHPIIQAPMAGVQDSTLALAVSAAGALGSLPCAMLSHEALKKELEILKSQTNNPININFFCHTPPTPNIDAENNWRKALQPFFNEFGIDPNDIPDGPSREPFSHNIADILEDFKPTIISFHFGLPAKDLLQRVNGWGTKIISSATTIEEALWLEANGADGIIAQGLEAGGHRGMFLSKDLNTQMGTFALLPQIVRRVNVPVIAAGGIADEHGVASALELGASAVQIGTAYLLCNEANVTPLYRTALKSDTAHQTAITNVFSGRPARGIINRVISELGPISTQTPEFPLALTAISALRSKAEAEGSSDFSPLWSGQNTSGCKEISATELTKQLALGVRGI